MKDGNPPNSIGQHISIYYINTNEIPVVRAFVQKHDIFTCENDMLSSHEKSITVAMAT